MTTLSNVTLSGNVAGTGSNSTANGASAIIAAAIVAEAPVSLTGGRDDQSREMQTSTAEYLPDSAPSATNRARRRAGARSPESGGTTQTMPLLWTTRRDQCGKPAPPGSGGATPAKRDQRNVLRPQLVRCDIGARSNPRVRKRPRIPGSGLVRENVYSWPAQAGITPVPDAPLGVAVVHPRAWGSRRRNVLARHRDSSPGRGLLLYESPSRAAARDLGMELRRRRAQHRLTTTDDLPPVADVRARPAVQSPTRRGRRPGSRAAGS